MSRALLALLLCAPAAAAGTAWSVTADTAAQVGAETTIVYRPSVPAGSELKADPLASATTDFVVVKAAARPDGTWAWTVLPLDEGPLRFVARWTLDGKPVEAPPAELTARAPVLPKDADIEDIKGPLAARRALWPWILAAVLGALAWEGWRRWKARPRPAGPAEPAAPPVPPEVAAERALEALAASGLWESGAYAPYYLRLTDILRGYLEARYGEPASAMTSAEVARLVKSREPDLKAAAVVRELLARADLVKFARVSPDAGQGPRDADLVRGVIRGTTPRVPAPAEAAS